MSTTINTDTVYGYNLRKVCLYFQANGYSDFVVEELRELFPRFSGFPRSEADRMINHAIEIVSTLEQPLI